MQGVSGNIAGSLLQFLSALMIVTLIHELGHMLMAWLTHIPIRRLSIGIGTVLWRFQLNSDREFILRMFPVGMAVGVPARRYADGSSSRSMWHDAMMAAAGPLVNLLLAVALIVLPAFGQFSPQTLSWFATVCILSGILGVANLIPVPGLDGGHLLMLAAERCGLNLSSRRESSLRRAGLGVVSMGCVLVVAIGLIGNLV